MLEKYLILALIPVMVNSSIIIEIKPKEIGYKSTLYGSGQDVDVISDKERETFKLDDQSLERISELYLGQRCSSTYLKPQTPFGDVYKKYGWNVVKRILRPVAAKILSIDSNPIEFKHVKYDINKTVTQFVTQKVSHTWSKGGELSDRLQINYDIFFGSISAKGNVYISYSSIWGQDITKMRNITIGTPLVPADLPAGTMPTLRALENIVEVEIRYLATVEGHVFCHYEREFRGYNFYSMHLGKLRNLGYIPQSVNATERITIRFYSSARLDLSES